MKQTTIFDADVATRIDQLLARCDRLKRGATISRPTKFDAAGQRHARSVAARDRGEGGAGGVLPAVLRSPSG